MVFYLDAVYFGVVRIFLINVFIYYVCNQKLKLNNCLDIVHMGTIFYLYLHDKTKVTISLKTVGKSVWFGVKSDNEKKVTSKAEL